MHNWRKQTDSKILSNTVQQAPIQMFRFKNEQNHDIELDTILSKQLSGWTKEEAERVRDLLDKGIIEAESNEELDKLYGILYGSYYDDFPNVEEFISDIEQGVYQEREASSGIVSQNQGNIYTGKGYFIKKVVGARNAANEVIVPIIAMRLGLQVHAVPAVWYQIGEDHYVVTKLMDGNSLEKVSELADENKFQGKLLDDKLIELFLFDFLVGSYDRTITNVFFNGGNITLIDNEGSLGLDGHGKQVGIKSGISRVGNKSPFLAAFFQKHGIKQVNEIITARFLHASKEFLNPDINIVIEKSLLNRMIIIGKEVLFLLEIFKVPNKNLIRGIQHMSDLIQHEKVYLKDFLI